MADGLSPLNDWRQGDLVLAPLELPVLILEGDELEIETIDAEHGAAIVSQSCDIVRDVEQRPFIQVAPLVRATPDELTRAEKGLTPTRVHIPAIASTGLLIDLEATVTVHKNVVATWQRSDGCQNDEERRNLGLALGRHRHRFAFPDEFNAAVKPFRTWIERKRKKSSHQGDLIRATREVRVQCEDWDEPNAVIFLIMLDQYPDSKTLAEWRAVAADLQKSLEDGIKDPEVKVVTYDNISARDYVNSDRLDWEGLSDA